MNWVPDLIPAAIRCRFPPETFTRRRLARGATSKLSDGIHAYNNGQTLHGQFLKCLCHSSPPPSSIRREVGGGGWLINQTTSTQPCNTLTRQGIYIPLHSCQEVGQQWIITPEQVLWRREHAGSDEGKAVGKGQQKEPAICSLSSSLMLMNRFYTYWIIMLNPDRRV